MAREPNQWTKRLIELLDDGQWHDHGDVMAEIAALVPTEDAWKKGEWYREYHYKRTGRQVAERRHGDRTDTIATGQRVIAGKAIENLRRKGMIEVEYNSDNPDAKRKRIARLRKI